MRKILDSRHWLVAVAVYVGLACLSFKDFLLSRLDQIGGNFGDNRFCIFVLEHWFRAFRWLEAWNDPRFFYPVQGVLGYTETMFVGSLPYALFRFLACDPYLSFELTLIAGTLCGYLSMIFLLRRWLNASEMLSIAGAAIFSLSNVIHLWILSAQTYTVMLLPGLLILFLQSVDNSPKARLRRPRNAFAFCALLSILYFSTFYIAYFFTLLFLLALVIYLLLAPVVSWRAAMPRPSVLMACCSGLALGFIPFFLTYGSSIAANHGFEFSQFLANAMGVRDILDPGTGDLVWGRLLKMSGGPSPMAYGVPPILALIFIGTILWLLRLRARGQLSQLHSALLASGLATILLLAATIRYHDKLFWYYLWCFLPGARTVRVLPRLFIVASLFITIISVVGLGELMRRAGFGESGPRLRRALLALLVAAIVVEQVNLASVHGISREREYSRLGNMPPAPSSCRSVFLVPSQSSANPIGLQVDVMLLAQRNNLPTVNGNSSLLPESWRLNIPRSPDYQRNLDEWLGRYGITDGSCGADIDNSVWLVTGHGNRNR
jgi:hypothetical protein